MKGIIGIIMLKKKVIGECYLKVKYGEVRIIVNGSR